MENKSDQLNELHICISDFNSGITFKCYEWKDGTLNLSSNDEYECEVLFCPFCGFSLNKEYSNKLSQEMKNKQLCGEPITCRTCNRPPCYYCN